MDKKRIGIFGGTFDPPHVGHQILAMEASEQLDLEQVLWVLTPDPPHKIGKKITQIDIREKMVTAAINDDPGFTLSSVDLDRPGPHYVLDTMKLLRSEYQNHELIFLMGGDSLHDLPQWHKPKEFIDACDKFGVMRRPGEIIDLYDLKKTLPGIINKIEFIDAPLLEISSNKIRQLVSTKKPYRYYLPFEVFKIIDEKHLYWEDIEPQEK
ncbi:MAG: nicotinate-nucleotide adenylyltransferase [Pelolinea sp.]|nr:nicotinate-nucleotide adenylyltransferase [Pelolinea sp.]